jgi:predicted translin family RNA/ssDNA-binding protein
MGLTEELSRYVIGRAIVRDISSVVLAKTMVEKILDYLLTFDFRNGYLRRKYDGVKYALKTCEQVLYELSVINTNETNNVDGIHQNETDMGTDQMLSDSSILPTDSLADLRKRIEHKDNIRESLIKNCRDAQKAAKQAIFAIHRGEHSRALKYIRDCETMIINILLPLTTEDPSLRWGGSLGAVMEEYVEAKLFFVWLHGTFGLEDGTLDSTAIHGDVRKTSTYPCGKIMHPLEFPFTVRPDEYLGALSDVTGEIGRFAVQRGTVRDTVGVTLCLDVCAMIVQSIESLHRYPYGFAGFGKKIDQLKRNVEKLERMLYEMSFIQATGRSLTTKDFASAETEGSTNNY